MNLLKKLGTFFDFDDNSIKCVFENKNHNILEITLLQNKTSRDVLCVPTHYFCTLGCKMCHLTNFFSSKKMLPIATDELIEAIMRTLCTEVENSLIRRTYKKDILISFMGVGEPLCNIKLIKELFLSNIFKEKLGYKEVCYSLATMFPSLTLFDHLKKVVSENKIPLKVHFSLHNPIDAKRLDLIPKAADSVLDIFNALKSYSVLVNDDLDILKEFRKFHKNTTGVEIHYTLIKDNNDGFSELKELMRLLNNFEFPIKFISFNPIGELRNIDEETDSIWKTVFKAYSDRLGDSFVKYYLPPGRNIGSSCGQFTRHYFIDVETEEEKKEFEEWRQKHEVEEKII